MEWYIGTEWTLERKGLRKKVLALDFTKLQKPHQVAKVVIKIESLDGLNGRVSNYLNSAQLGKIQHLEMGTALTPIDCYLELLVRQMLLGEKAQCTISTSKAGESISIILTLEQIVESKEIHKLSVVEMHALALRYKENGVTMFKEYPRFAHEYFVIAAKCLLSYKPHEGLTLKEDGVEGRNMQALLVQVQTNLAACLLAQQRYEDVIYQTEFVETQPEPNEKGIYRRAVAYYNLKEFAKAQQTIERVANHHDKKEFVKLQQQIAERWKTSKDEYKTIVQRMFN